MNVSVIIPTFNNAVMLATTLLAFERVQFPESTELIVVDNNSTDDTADTVKSFLVRLPVRYAFEPNKGVSAAKNRGLRMAGGKLLIFTDDDVPAGSSLDHDTPLRVPQEPKGLFLWRAGAQ